MKKLIAVLLCTLLLTSAAALAEDYTFGTDTAFRPFEYTDETGTLVGIDVELLAAIAEDQGFTYTIEPLGWDASIAACQAGQKDAMIAGASMVLIWHNLIRPMGGVFGIYELLPAFLFSALAIFVVSLLTPEPEKAVLDEFDHYMDESTNVEKNIEGVLEDSLLIDDVDTHIMATAAD